jgi:hypothetical protein
MVIRYRCDVCGKEYDVRGSFVPAAMVYPGRG